MTPAGIKYREKMGLPLSGPTPKQLVRAALLKIAKKNGVSLATLKLRQKNGVTLDAPRGDNIANAMKINGQSVAEIAKNEGVSITAIYDRKNVADLRSARLAISCALNDLERGDCASAAENLRQCIRMIGARDARP